MSEKNTDFEALKQLLKLKQHECPPPGYFNHFSGDVTSRIRAGEANDAQSVLGRIQGGSPSLAKFLRVFEAKPGVIGAFATSLCVLLLVGVVLADRPEGAALNGGTEMAQAMPDASPTLASAVPLAPADGTGISISTNPVSSLQPVAALFGSQQQNPLFQSAAFMPAGQ